MYEYMKINSMAVGKNDEVPFWFNPYNELYGLLYGTKESEDQTITSESNEEVNTILVGAFFKRDKNTLIQFEMDELEELVEVLGHKCISKFVQRIDIKYKSNYIGQGKMLEIKDFIIKEKVNCVVCNNELTSLQFKQLVDVLRIPVIDRTMIVLEIFSRNARTRESKLQIQIALMQYLASRINSINLSEKNLSDRANGSFFNKGKGESVYELNQRKIKNHIARLEKEIEKIGKTKSIQQKNRKNAIKFILVGYTNAGKTSILNALSEESLSTGNQMFLTTDSVYRYIGNYHGTDILMCDTVGFLSNLPTTWLEGFHTTIKEIIESNFILHIVDINDEYYEKKMEVTNKILNDLKIDKRKVILIYNKVDLIDLNTISGGIKNEICVSTCEKASMDELRKILFKRVKYLCEC